MALNLENAPILRASVLLALLATQPVSSVLADQFKQKRIVLMDSHQFSYNSNITIAGTTGTNIDKISAVLRYLVDNVEIFAEHTHPNWDRDIYIRAMKPDLAIVHLSAFDRRLNEGTNLSRLLVFLEEMSGTETKFIIYSRTFNIETAENRKSMLYSRYKCASSCVDYFRFLRITDERKFPCGQDMLLTLPAYISELLFPSGERTAFPSPVPPDECLQ